MRVDLKKVKRRITAGVVAAFTTIVASPLYAYAAESVTIKDNLDPEKVIGKVLGYLLTAGQLVGGGVIIYALISFGLSIAQENPDQRSRAIMFVVAGAFLVGIKPILKGIGVIG